MADCIIEGLIDPTCEEQNLIGGVKPKNIYVINRDDLDASNPYNQAGAGNITAFNFNTYGEAVKLVAMRRSVVASQTQEEGDNTVSYWVQTVQGKFEQQSQSGKNAIEALAKAQDLIIVIEKMDGTFEVYGLKYGLKMRTSTKSTGTLPGDDNKWTLIFNQTGYGEDAPAPDFFTISYATTKALLESYTS